MAVDQRRDVVRGLAEGLRRLERSKLTRDRLAVLLEDAQRRGENLEDTYLLLGEIVRVYAVLDQLREFLERVEN